MFLLATVRKCWQLSCIKRRQTSLLSIIQLKKLNTFRDVSDNVGYDRSQVEDKIYDLNKPPQPPEIGECCESGCQNCVYVRYFIEVRYFHGNKKEKIQEALDSIPSPDIKAFVEMEAKKLFKF